MAFASIVKDLRPILNRSTYQPTKTEYQNVLILKLYHLYNVCERPYKSGRDQTTTTFKRNTNKGHACRDCSWILDLFFFNSEQMNWKYVEMCLRLNYIEMNWKYVKMCFAMELHWDFLHCCCNGLTTCFQSDLTAWITVRLHLQTVIHSPS